MARTGTLLKRDSLKILSLSRTRATIKASLEGAKIVDLMLKGAGSSVLSSRTGLFIFNNMFVYRGFYFYNAEDIPNCGILTSGTPHSNVQHLISSSIVTDDVGLVMASKYRNGATILPGLHPDQNASFLSGHAKAIGN
ncbi:Biotin-protein ligase N-terminal domain containing protein [Cryptosporidium felis]|nr:Biotin-protein ligase N-terminal domain containing protein [Cryptosporidium felis]